MASTAATSPGIVNSLYPAEQQRNHIPTMDIQNDGMTTPDEIFSQLDQGASESFDLYQNCMQPTNSIEDINLNLAMEPTTGISQILPNYEITTQLSVPTREAAYRVELPPRFHESNPSRYVETAAAEAARQLRQGFIRRKQKGNRDSNLSIISYNSADTDISVNTKHSSMTSLESQSSRSSRKFCPQRSSGSSISLKKTHGRSSSLSVASNPPSEILCTYPNCTTTFTREPDRARHEASKHNSRPSFTCLLHTCAKSCQDDCKNRQHNLPYYNARADKMKEHLEKEHGWSLRQRDIPTSFLKPYERHQRGWRCRVCKADLGSWHDKECDIEAHPEHCMEDLHISFKRMSVEEPGNQGLKKLGSADTDKALPETPLDFGDDEYWTTEFLDGLDLFSSSDACM